MVLYRRWLLCCIGGGCSVVLRMVVLYRRWLWCCIGSGCGVVYRLVVVLYRQWFWCCLFFVFAIARRRTLIMICPVSCLISSPGVSLCHGLLSVVRPSLAFHIFDISSRTMLD